jgi:hypothetical protein
MLLLLKKSCFEFNNNSLLTDVHLYFFPMVLVHATNNLMNSAKENNWSIECPLDRVVLIWNIVLSLIFLFNEKENKSSTHAKRSHFSDPCSLVHNHSLLLTDVHYT